MKTNDMLLLGALALGAYFLLGKGSSAGGGGGGGGGYNYIPDNSGGNGSAKQPLPGGTNQHGVIHTTNGVATATRPGSKIPFVISYPQHGIVGNAPRATYAGFNFLLPPPIKY